ncbi:MAG: threonine synthase [Planctomycetes bacterium]|nr:threonine synthase [Planctomycetota bacterium]
MRFATHLEATSDGTTFALDSLQTCHDGQPIAVRYDLRALAANVERDALRRRPPGMWRYRELLPHASDAEVVSLGENATPLLPCPRLGARLGLSRLLIKDESTLPTGSFKARGMAMAITRAKALGVTHVATPTAGNAGGALAAYAARAGLRCTVLMPADTPLVNQREVHWYGARAFAVDGLIHECGAIVRQGAERGLWFDMSTMKEPYRLEGKKTMGLELADQLGWRLPDAIFYPTGGGTGLVGMHKAFAELRELGWLDPAAPLPRLFACQASGCAPVVTAFENGSPTAELVPDATTAAAGLRVPKPFADRMILTALRESGGAALAAPEAELSGWVGHAMRDEGIALCPEAAACLVGARQALARGLIAAGDEIVVFNTGAAQKYVEFLAAELPRLDRAAPDWVRLAGADDGPATR